MTWRVVGEERRSAPRWIPAYAGMTIAAQGCRGAVGERIRRENRSVGGIMTLVKRNDGILTCL